MSAEFEKGLERSVSICRQEILSLVEAVYGSSAQWQFVRTRILHAFGDKGLMRRISKGVGASEKAQGEVSQNKSG